MNKLDKNIALVASILGALTIVIGAFGAHGLEKLVSAEAIRTFETGVRYQMYHVLALLVIALMAPIPASTKKWVYRFFCFGILLFSGSIYMLALQETLLFSVTFLGPVTPIGGLLFILGWIKLSYSFITLKR